MYLSRPLLRSILSSALLVAMSAVVSGPAAAHVKWFCGPTDVTVPPLGLRDVVSPPFLSRAVGFVLLVMAASLVDAMIARRWPSRMLGRGRFEVAEELLIRLGVGGYAICLWNNTAMVPWGAGATGAILTPELFEHDRLVGLLQLAVAAMLLFRRTCPLAGLGLAVLYAVGVARYGAFHMTDYVYFLGLAGYLVLSAPHFDRRPGLRSWRVSLLAGCLSFSLMWTAIEKFLYPAWTEIILATHPNLTLGFPLPFVTVTAGFVEFSLAFYLLVGRSLLWLNALALILVFVSAMPEFGNLDLVGHLPIVAILLVVVIHGSTRLQEVTRPQGMGPLRSAVSVAGLFAVSLVTLMAMYYGLQQTVTWL